MSKNLSPFYIAITIILFLVMSILPQAFPIPTTMAEQLTDNNTINLLPTNTPRIGHITKDAQLDFNKTTHINDQGEQIVTNLENILVLVNKNRSLPDDYRPQHMVVPDVEFPYKEASPKKYLRPEAAQALEKLFRRATDEGLTLLASSGYRSYIAQKCLFEGKIADVGEKKASFISAYPGQSEHQTGLAMDLTCPEVNYVLVNEFAHTKEGIWLGENAHKYGFIIRYPKEKEAITGYIYEPWHIRYVGQETAKYLFENNLTLEEFFMEVYNY